MSGELATKRKSRASRAASAEIDDLLVCVGGGCAGQRVRVGQVRVMVVHDAAGVAWDYERRIFSSLETVEQMPQAITFLVPAETTGIDGLRTLLEHYSGANR